MTGITHLNWDQSSHTFQRSFALNTQFHPLITNYYDYNYYELSKVKLSKLSNTSTIWKKKKGFWKKYFMLTKAAFIIF